MELFRFIAVSLILISALSFARAQVADCLPLSETDLGTMNALSTTGLVGAAFQAVSGDPSPVNVQVHGSRIVCLSSGLTRDMFSGASVVVNYTCTGAPSECTGHPTVSQFEFECVANPDRWNPSAHGGSAANIITTPPNGTLSTPLRTDCIVCVSPARPAFATITNNEQHCGFVDCGPLRYPLNGAVDTPQGTIFHQVATYSCNDMYVLVGNKTRTCQEDGRWSGYEPYCELLCIPQCVNGNCVNGICMCPAGYAGQDCSVVDCGALMNPDNGRVNTSQGTTLNRLATYSCNCGYCLVGDETRTCQTNGQWSGSEPTCNSLSIPADTVTPVSSTYLNDIPTVAAIAIAMISLVTSVATVAIMVCFVIFLLKRFSAVTKRQNQQYMDKQQTVADATPPATPPSEQDKIYGTEV